MGGEIIKEKNFTRGKKKIGQKCAPGISECSCYIRNLSCSRKVC